MMLQHPHAWLRPPYLYPSAKPKEKHKLAGWQQALIILAAVVMPFLIPVMLTVWHQQAPIYLVIVFVFSILLAHFPKSFLTAITLTALPFLTFYGVSGLRPLYLDLADYRTVTAIPFAMSLVPVLTVYYAVILEVWQTRINGSPTMFWRSILIATAVLVFASGILPFALLSQNLLFVTITTLVILYAPFVPPTLWVSASGETRLHPVALEAASGQDSLRLPHPQSTVLTSEGHTLPTESVGFAPYNATEFYLVGLVLGVIGTAVMAVINARRMGQQKGFWTMLFIAALIVLTVTFAPIASELSGWLGFIASVVFVIGVVEWQKPNYRLWLEAHNDQAPTWSERGGWLRFGLVIGLAVILYLLVNLLIRPVYPLTQVNIFLMSIVGCVITMFGPAAYDIFTHEHLQLKQMRLYTAGWLASLLFAGIWIVTGLMASDGYGGGGSLRDTEIEIIFWSSVAYIPVLVAALVFGWITFRFKHFSLARVFMLLPIVNIIVYVIMLVSLDAR